jgi:hypothetical protein
MSINQLAGISGLAALGCAHQYGAPCNHCIMLQMSQYQSFQTQNWNSVSAPLPSPTSIALGKDHTFAEKPNKKLLLLET